jgi:hypothetical protein
MRAATCFSSIQFFAAAAFSTFSTFLRLENAQLESNKRKMGGDLWRRLAVMIITRNSTVGYYAKLKELPDECHNILIICAKRFLQAYQIDAKRNHF